VAVRRLHHHKKHRRKARLAFHGWRLIVDGYRDGWKQAHIAAAMGVSRTCVKTWIDRYRAEGEQGAVRALLTAAHDAHQDSRKVEGKVLAARAEHRKRPDSLAPKVGMPVRTVSRILRRHHVPHLRECDPMTGEAIRASETTAARYEREQPGELVHMDVKKLGKIPTGQLESPRTGSHQHPAPQARQGRLRLRPQPHR